MSLLRCTPLELRSEVVVDLYSEGPRFGFELMLTTTECSAMRNRGVSEAFTEAARVALAVKPAKAKEDSKCSVM